MNLTLHCSLTLTISAFPLSLLMPGATGIVDDVLRTGMVAQFSAAPLYAVSAWRGADPSERANCRNHCEAAGGAGLSHP